MSLLISTAEFSPCRTWRYQLKRQWQEGDNLVAFVGLNPSTADETKNDPTVTRCIKYAQTWDYDGMFMLNIFAYRATDPKVMREFYAPVGPDNNKWILNTVKECRLVVACWGNHGSFLERGKVVASMIQDLKCLKITKAGHPSHPLYLKSSLMPVDYAWEKDHGCQVS
jgi:hypothetical protein